MDACYVCEVAMPPLAEPEVLEDGSLYYKELDGNGQRICEPCEREAWDITSATSLWPSSEDRDLWIDNAAAEGLRRGRAAAAKEREEQQP